MKKITDGEAKSFNSKLWISIISIVLCVATVAVACLGVALFNSNNNIAELQSDLDLANDALDVLNADNKALAEEIVSLQDAQKLSEEELKELSDKYAQAQEDLKLLSSEQKRLEGRLDSVEAADQSVKTEVESLKNELDSAREELEQLKEQIKATDDEDKIRIYIDQGHNPAPHHNSGASGNGLQEHDVTFLIGCILADLLKSDGRFEVQLSRPNKSVVLGTDNKSSLMARVEGAAAFEADYFISLHINAFTSETATGIEVFAAEEGSESYVFGETLLNAMFESTGLRNRGMKLGPDLDVLEFSTMPAVLLEMGFISNPDDAALLSKKPELFATGIYNGILEYFGLLAPIAA